MFEELLRHLSLNVTGLANALRVLLGSSIAQGQLVPATLLSGATTVVVRHGLGRAAQGAFVAGSSAAGAFTVDLVAGADSVTVRVLSAPGSNVSLKVWVF